MRTLRSVVASDARGMAWLDSLAQDLRHALRGLGRTPAFAATVVLILALGIGLSTAVFTVADVLLIRRLPVRDQNRIVVLWGEGHRRTDWPIRPDEAREFARRTHSLESVAFISYYGAIDKPISEADHISRFRQTLVSGGFFDVLGVKPALGRALNPGDDVTGAAHSVVLSYAAWQRRFGGDVGVLGRRLLTHDDAMTFTIVGVMPQGFEYPGGTDYWAAGAATVQAGNPLYTALHLIGRLRQNASADNARDDLTAFLTRPDGPSSERDFRGVAHTLPELVLGDTKPAVIVFAAAAALLLLITCINVANLLLVRGIAKAREIAVRTALGGTRVRIVAHLLAESAVLASIGGALGLAVAAIAVDSFVAFAPPGMPRLDEIHVNAAALGGAVTITAIAMLVFAIVPAFTTSRVDVQQVLRSDTRQTASRRSRFMNEMLAAGQVALAVLVLSTAGLVARSLLKLERAALSLEPSHLLIGELSLPSNTFDSPAKQLAMLDRLIPRLEAIPGVQAASPLVAVPFSGSHGWDGPFSAEGQSAAEIAANPMLNMERGGPGYFATLGVPVLRGRGIAASDREEAPPVVVISQSAAHHFWPGDDPIGKRLFMGSARGDTVTVIGIVPDTRYRDLRDARPSAYFPLHQQTFFPVPMTLAIRVGGSPAQFVPTIRRVLMEAEPGVGLASAAPFEAFLAAPLAQPRLNALLLGMFAGAAVVLACIGLFGVMATMVRQRRREFGIRMALGAGARDVRRTVTHRGLMIATPGIAVGLMGAIVANRLIAALLYEVSPTDVATLVAVSGLLLITAAAATLIPARSTTRISPTEALRAE